MRILLNTLITGLFLVLTTACLAKDDNDRMSEDGVGLSPSSVACYGSTPGKCKSGNKYISQNEYVSNVANEPSHVKSVFYFKGRDDKVILEYVSVEGEFVQRSVQNIYSYMINATVLSDKEKYLQEQKKHVLEQCPVKDGCKQLIELINQLNGNNRSD